MTGQPFFPVRSLIDLFPFPQSTKWDLGHSSRIVHRCSITKGSVKLVQNNLQGQDALENSQ
jgi:hypothetical protein